MLAALVMVSISAGLGFFGGRMSAWLLPVHDERATQEGRQSRPDKFTSTKPGAPAPTASASQVKPAQAANPDRPIAKEENTSTASALEPPDPATSRPQTSEPLPGASQTPARGAIGTEPGSIRIALAADPAIVAGAAQPPVAPDFTIKNPDSAAKGSDLGEERRSKPASDALDRPDAAALEQCQRRYSSFRASDGTYQPLDGGPRRACRLLR